MALLVSTGKYKVVDVDASSPAYYGYLAANGDWFIMKETTSGNVTSYRFTRGISGYETAWTNRASKTYTLTVNLE